MAHCQQTTGGVTSGSARTWSKKGGQGMKFISPSSHGNFTSRPGSNVSKRVSIESTGKFQEKIFKKNNRISDEDPSTTFEGRIQMGSVRIGLVR